MHRDELRIPSPCNADWNAMEPRERGRFCSACELEVVDISARTEAEVRELAGATRASRTSRVCVSYLVNRDGTIRLAADPSKPDVPTSALARRGARMLAAASIALAACGPGSFGRLAGEPVSTVATESTESTEPCERVAGGIGPVDTTTPEDASVAPLPPPSDETSEDAGVGATIEPKEDYRLMLGELEY